MLGRQRAQFSWLRGSRAGLIGTPSTEVAALDSGGLSLLGILMIDVLFGRHSFGSIPLWEAQQPYAPRHAYASAIRQHDIPCALRRDAGRIGSRLTVSLALHRPPR
jgi:hypothetical protein